MLFLILSLLAVSLFLSIFIFIGMLLVLGGGCLLVYKYPERYKNKLSSYLLKIFVVFFSVFIVIVLIEVYLHLAQPSFLEAKTGVVGDLTDYQSQGYVNEKTFAKPEGTFRILGLGDSFAVSDYDLQKNYHNFLSAALKAAGYNHIDIVNAGLANVGPGYYWHILNKYGEAWKPDLVLVGFFVGNDFGEMDFFGLRGPFIKEPQEPWQRWPGYLRFHNFWLYKVVKGKLTLSWEKRRKAQEKMEALADQEGSFSRQAFLAVEKNRMQLFEKDKKADLEGLWKRKADLLLKFKEWCAQRDIPLVIAIFPDQFQVDRDLRQEIYQTYQVSAADLDLTYPNRLLSGYCRQQGILCLDLLAPFQEKGGSQTLYKLRDSHWNEAGNRLAGELIFNFLTAHRVVRGR